MPAIAFGAPQLLPLALVAVLAAGLYLWVARRRRRAEAAYRAGAATSLRAAGYSARRQTLKAALVVVAVALLGLAAARPQVGTHRTLLERQGTDILVALDVSLSMSARDVQPSRLDRARGAVSALFDHLQGDRVGLVTFAGSAQLRFPMTTDLEAARKVVDGVTFKDGGLAGGTSIGAALRQASDGFANDATRSKILLLVSDGEDLGDDAAQAAEFVHSEGIVLDTLGVGLAAPTAVVVMNPRTGQLEPRKDPTTGGDLLTTADAKALRQLASANGGRFFNGNTDDFAIQLSDEIGRLQKTKFDSGEGDVPVERFQILVTIAIALLLFDLVLPAGRSGRPRRWRIRSRLQRGAALARSRAPADTGSGGD